MSASALPGSTRARTSVPDLTARPPAETGAIPVLPLNVRYRFAGRHTELFLGTSLEDLAQFDLPLQVGAAHQFAGKGIIAAAAVASTVPTRVWADPYVVNQARTSTARTSRGARLEWDRILGSQARVRFTRRTVDIEDERSGTTQLGLPAAELAALDREGSISELVLAYRFRLADRHSIEPQLIGTRGDLDGKAMAYDYGGVKLAYTYQHDRITLVSTLSAGRRDYDAVNPVFGRSREDDSFGLGATLLYRDLFGAKNWMGLAALGAYREDSNIDFYDNDVDFVALAVLYRL